MSEIDAGSYRERRSTTVGGTLWTRTADGAAGWILPDGCLDVLWDGRDLTVAGPDTVGRRTEAPAGTSYAALRFDSGVGPVVLGLPADALRDQQPLLADVLPRAEVERLADALHAADTAAAGLVAAAAGGAADLGLAIQAGAAQAGAADLGLAAQVGAAQVGAVQTGAVQAGAAQAGAVQVRTTAGGAVGIGPAGLGLERWATGRLGAGPSPDASMRRVVELLDGGLRVSDVADAVGLGERQLHRRSLIAFGYGPKVLARILRMQRALALARHGTQFARTAAEAGYADQAHLAREVRALAGRPLGQLVTTG